MKINILGEKYEITETTAEKNEKLDGADGYCSHYEKYILMVEEPFADDKHASETEKENRKKLIKRHEIIHAFITESGILDSAMDNEFCVHWVAMQFPKLLKAFKEVGAIE